MAPINMSLEIELGVTGGEEDGVGHEIEEGGQFHLYRNLKMCCWRMKPSRPSDTSPSRHLSAMYMSANLVIVQLRPEILKNSQALVSSTHGTGANPLHLVFHGGSGSEPAKIAEAVSYGVFKMNIDTDTQFAFASAEARMSWTTRWRSVTRSTRTTVRRTRRAHPRKWLRLGEEGMVERLQRARRLGRDGTFRGFVLSVVFRHGF